MKIGIVSDSHSKPISKRLIDDFKKVDLIIHAGDFCSKKDYDQFAETNKIEAVYGNMDDLALRKHLTETKILDLDGIKVGIYHGFGPTNKVIDFVLERFKNEKLDLVIFGHSHKVFDERINGTLYFNPGTIGDQVFAPYRSYGIIEIINNQIKTSVINIDK